MSKINHISTRKKTQMMYEIKETGNPGVVAKKYGISFDRLRNMIQRSNILKTYTSEGVEYRFCASCLAYLTEDRFWKYKNNKYYYSYCKNCDNQRLKNRNLLKKRQEDVEKKYHLKHMLDNLITK